MFIQKSRCLGMVADFAFPSPQTNRDPLGSANDLNHSKHEQEKVNQKIQNLLELRIQRAERENQPRKVEDIADKVRGFIKDFRLKFESTPVELQKLILQKCVSEIVVDPDELVAHVYVREIPALTPEIEKGFNSRESKALVDTAACARDLNFRSLTQLHRMFDMSLSR